MDWDNIWDNIKTGLLVMLVVIVVVVLVYFPIRGCKGLEQDVAHIKSSYVGLERQVTLYAVDGTAIKSWKGKYQVEVNETGVRFIHKGKVIELNGTFLVEEIE